MRQWEVASYNEEGQRLKVTAARDHEDAWRIALVMFEDLTITCVRVSDHAGAVTYRIVPEPLEDD